MSSEKTRSSEGSKEMEHRCTTCMRPIVSEFYVQCCRCHGFVQCLECYAYGFEKGQHVRSHPFIFMESSTSPVFASDWTAEEELLLLNAISLCGFGNWVEIARLIPPKTAGECKSHYIATYLAVDNAPIPEITVKPPAPPAPPPPFCTAPCESCPSDGHEKILAEKGKKEKTNPAEVYGYMPKRHEFDEYNDEAEHIIDGVSFDEETETKESLDLKLESLLCYCSQVVDRRRRTKVIEDAGLQYNPTRTLGGKTPAEREIDNKVQTLAPYIGFNKALEIANTIHEYARLCERIRLREWWQKNGVRSHPEGFLFQKLEALIKENKLPKTHIDEWNHNIEEYSRNYGSDDVLDVKLLSVREIELCRNCGIGSQYYLGLKDVLVRECAVRGSLSRAQAVSFDPNRAMQVIAVYEFCLSSGWITGE